MDDAQIFWCYTLENEIKATRYRDKAINRDVFLLVTPRMCIINLYTRPCFKGRSSAFSIIVPSVLQTKASFSNKLSF